MGAKEEGFEKDGLTDDDDNLVTHLEDDKNLQEKLPYPKSVFFIVSNEFCERFSYYGMRTILSLYLADILLYEESTATIIYHTFTMFVYFFPIFGAILSDSLLGKFRTILYLSIIYSCGNIVLAMAATPALNFPMREISMLGLLLIALGTGGIKPCVSAFGGDQFILPQQEAQLATFFSLFYFSINSGSLISTLLTPILREDVKCFGQDSCYSLAFAIPGVLMIVSIIIFGLGKPLYRIRQPEGNMLVKVSKCIGNAISTKWSNKGEKKEHWLDYAEPAYGEKLVKEVKAVLKVLVLYIPLPVFWALFDQQGSLWTFMARRMNGDIGFITILPDQMQVVNPLLILIFIPLFQYVIYPLLTKCKVLRTPLQRLVAGGALAAISFIVSAIISLALESSYPVLPTEGNGQLRVYNSLPCNISMTIDNGKYDIPSLGMYKDIDINVQGSLNKNYKIRGCSNEESGVFEIKEHKAMAYYFRNINLKSESVIDNVDKNSRGNPNIRYIIQNYSETFTLTMLNSKDKEVVQRDSSNVTLFDLVPDEYTVQLSEEYSTKVALKLGGVYTFVAAHDGKTWQSSLIEITEPNKISIMLLLPQYIIITMGEIMYSITGLEFAYSQAPPSMKSVLQACWLLTTAFGNLIVIIIESIGAFEQQSNTFFLYAGIMLVDMAIFSLMAMKYKYVEKEDAREDLNLPETKQNGIDNVAFKKPEET